MPARPEAEFGAQRPALPEALAAAKHADGPRHRLAKAATPRMCERVRVQHVAEFPAFVPALRKELGMLLPWTARCRCR
jgi:hypothetical protein